MSWFYRIFKLKPYSSSGRTEGKIQIQKVNELEWDTSTTNATVSGNVVTLVFDALTKLGMSKLTCLSLDVTKQASIYYSYGNMAIFASTATPWLKSTTVGGDAGVGSLWLTSGGTGPMFIKTGTATTAWAWVMTAAT
jgi:hypothetical protein